MTVIGSIRCCKMKLRKVKVGPYGAMMARQPFTGISFNSSVASMGEAAGVLTWAIHVSSSLFSLEAGGMVSDTFC